MEKTISDEAVVKATGKTSEQWYALLSKNKLQETSHKDIAAFLSKREDVSFWWAQELTVLYEKHLGRRVVGQTKDSGFQLGVSKTMPYSKTKLWQKLFSEEGLQLIIEDKPDVSSPEIIKGRNKNGLEYEITTYKPNSHFRMKYKRPDWQSHSILQVRCTEKNSGKTTLTFHHEKLPDKTTREQMKKFWEEKIMKLQDLFS